MHQHTTTMWTHAGHVLMREGNTQPGMWHPAGVYECQDGYVFLCHAGGAKLIPFLQAAGLGDLLEDPRFETDVARGSHKKEFNEAIRPWLMSHTVDEICELGVATFSPMGPVWDMHQFLADPHLEGARLSAAARRRPRCRGDPPRSLPDHRRGGDSAPHPSPRRRGLRGISWRSPRMSRERRRKSSPTAR